MPPGAVAMVDREARDEYADIIEAFLRGEMSNHQYDDAASRLGTNSEDDVIEEVYCFLWGGYCDVNKQRADDLHAEARTAFRRCAVFLRSDRDFAWPPDALCGSRAEGCAVLCVWGFVFVAGLCLLLWALTGLSWVPVMIAGALAIVAWLFVQWRRHRRRQTDEKLAEIGDIDAFPFLSMKEYQEEAARQVAGPSSANA